MRAFCWRPAVVLLLVTALAGATDSGATPLRIGDVTVAPQLASGAWVPVLRQAVQDELHRQSSPPGAEPMVLGAHLLSLEEQVTEGRVTVDCQVSATLTDARSGALKAILQSTVRASEAAGRGPEARREAVVAAGQAAVRRAAAALR